MLLIVMGSLALSGCDDMFDFSPYESVVKRGHKNTTLDNLEKILNLNIKDSTIRFAVIADSHNDYDNLEAAINSINNDPGILFVLHAGDFTDLGLLEEYEIFHGIMNRLTVPYLTVIGNHDYRSNGGKIYKDMFGSYNYSFFLNNIKFILFDNVMLESGKKPDSAWFREELSDQRQHGQIFVLSHIPPFSNEFSEQQEDEYNNLMSGNGITLSLHGHHHTYSYGGKNNVGVKYIVVPRSKENSYIIVSADKYSVNVEKVLY